MKNQKGFAEIAVLYIVIAGLVALFVPNPISSSLGVGIRPNKTVQTQVSKERVELLKDKDGNIIATKTYTDDSTCDIDKQQRVSIWEQLRSLPILFLILTGAGVIFPVVGVRLFALYRGIKKEFLSHKSDTTRIVKGLDAAFATIPKTLAGTSLPGEIDRAALSDKIINAMKQELGYNYNDSTKSLVRSIKGV